MKGKMYFKVILLFVLGLKGYQINSMKKEKLSDLLRSNLLNGLGRGNEELAAKELKKSEDKKPVTAEPTDANLAIGVLKAKNEFSKDIHRQAVSDARVKDEGVEIAKQKQLERRAADLEFMDTLRNPLLIEELKKKIGEKHTQKRDEHSEDNSDDEKSEKTKPVKTLAKDLAKNMDSVEQLKDPKFLAELKIRLNKQVEIEKGKKNKPIKSSNILSEISDASLSKNNLKNKVLADAQENAGLDEIIPTPRERNLTKTNNPVVVNYSVRNGQLLELMRH